MFSKKILQINSVVNYGSTGRIAEEIGLLIRQKGGESYIAYGRCERQSKSKLIRIGNGLGIKFHVILTRLFDVHGLGSTYATKNLIKKIKKINPDIIHLHNLHGYYINFKILFEYLSKIKTPVVWTLHDCWAITGHCTHFTYAKCDKWHTHCSHCPQKKEYPTSFFWDNSYNNYRLKKKIFTSVENLTVVPVSIWLENIIQMSYLKNNSIKTINNGIDIQIFHPKANTAFMIERLLDNKFLILGVASVWSVTKGLADFIRLSNLLTDGEVLILVGLKQNEILNLPHNIIGISRINSVLELAGIYANSDVYVNLTYEDTFPTTNLESLACGTPVITYKTGGSPESITKETGIVVEKGDIDAVIKAITTIKGNGKSYYSNFCRRRAEQFYNKDNKFKEYLQLYNEILNGQ